MVKTRAQRLISAIRGLWRIAILVFCGILITATAALTTAATASASTAAPAVHVIRGGYAIWRACSALQNGEWLIANGQKYQCQYVPGLGWYYIRYFNGHCGGAAPATAPARPAGAPVC